MRQGEYVDVDGGTRDLGNVRQGEYGMGGRVTRGTCDLGNVRQGEYGDGGTCDKGK